MLPRSAAFCIVSPDLFSAPFIELLAVLRWRSCLLEVEADDELAGVGRLVALRGVFDDADMTLDTKTS